jgi:hypothetical protein
MDSPAEPVEIRIDPSEAVARSVLGVAPAFSNCHRRKLEEYPKRETTVGEINSADFVETASFEYQEREDSHISVAVEGAQGGWGARGEYHLDKGTGATAIVHRSDGANYRVTSFFTYVRNRVVCGGGEDGNYHEEIRAELWEGGVGMHAQNSPGCRGSKWARDWSSDSELIRNSYTAHTWKGAASVGPATFSAHSGFSKYLTNKWKFDRSRPWHVVCGDDNHVTRSSRVFFGEEPYRIPECRPGKPC